MMLTVFTPAYNRAKLLPRLYQSLLEQSCTDFEWLVVDDGSTDDTASVIRSFAEERKIDICYFRKENGGKHTAYNYALEKARGEWFFCVDADDFLGSDAVARILNTVRNHGIGAGIIAYKEDVHGKLLSDRFPQNVDCCRISDLPMRHNCCGEFSLVLPKEIAAAYQFPVFPGERFIGESVVYDRIDEEHRVRLLPEVLTVCEYQPDGYSSNFTKLMKQNPCGFCLYFLQRIDLQLTVKQRLIHAGKYWSFRWISKNRELKYRGKHRALVALAVIPGMAFRIYYKLFRHI